MSDTFKSGLSTRDAVLDRNSRGETAEEIAAGEHLSLRYVREILKAEAEGEDVAEFD